MAQSLVVDQEGSVSPGNGVVRPRASSSAYSVFHHQHQPSVSSLKSNAPGHRPRAKSSSHFVGRLEPKFEFRDHTLIDQDGNFRLTDSGIAELIDFLKNHAPPADNFMSMPDEGNESKGKWAKLKKLAKRKSRSKLPDPITLPDSAVSGITTEGHRHIAISIPIDASPFGRSPRTQYPVYQNPSLRPPPGRYGPTRAVLNDKGVVTILRTVTEDQETSAPSSPRVPRVSQAPSPLSSNPTRGPPMSNSYSNVGTPSNASKNGNGKVSEYFGVSSSPPRTLLQEQSRRANEASRELRSYGQPTASSSTAARQDGLPVRGSSLVANRFIFPQTPSIDAMMSEATTVPDNLQSASVYASSSSKDVSHQSSFPKTLLALNDNDADVIPVKASQSSLGESPFFQTKKKEDPPVTVITRNPLASSDGHTSPTPSIHSTQSQTRREKVREKKRRDIEALRTGSRNRNSMQSQMSRMSQQSQQSQQGEDYGDKQQVSIDLAEEGSKSPRKEKPSPLPLNSPSRHSLCAIMVVSDIQPSPPNSSVPETSPTESSPPQPMQTESSPRSAMVIQAGPPEVEPPLQSPPLHGGFPKPPKTKPQFRPKPTPRSPSISGKPGTVSPIASFNSSNNPTPPQSVKGSPLQTVPSKRTSMQSSVDRSSKHSSVDRTSKQSSLDRHSKQGSIDRLSKHGSVGPASKPQSPVDQATKRHSIDRTSLSRRREWNATREQERRAPDSRMGSRQLPRPLVMSKEEVEEAKSTATPTDRDMSRRYDVYREYRIREMERRLRRLERNGDVWLRALVPVLENLNRTLAHQQGDHDRAQGWVSDEDLVGSLSPPRGRAAFGGSGNRRSRMMPRPGVSEREFLEHLVRTKEELEAGNNSDDMSGFDTIEPLMRELAGRSRLSFEARSMAFAEDDELMFRGF
ncbi:hypothetical protein B0J13DRAFT_186837 [Dactylonectria estremocensis]|uniref:Uncharacterized protein n=1 Tax=Dactylonectria estremocensis TaxID=1079267 RepID=A0A9P9FDL0_9HYPO|nr:hypothetical protein B0J13DRAFT_186837 [Dactylonectria estremocensis]